MSDMTREINFQWDFEKFSAAQKITPLKTPKICPKIFY
jgi:hypothetical protein